MLIYFFGHKSLHGAEGFVKRIGVTKYVDFESTLRVPLQKKVKTFILSPITIK